MGRQHVAADARSIVQGAPASTRRRGSGHLHRINSSKMIDKFTKCERCYCGARRYTGPGDEPGKWAVSPWFFLERPQRDVRTIEGHSLARLHREMLVCALFWAQLCDARAPTPDITAAAERFERAAAQWAIGLGTVGRQAKAKP